MNEEDAATPAPPRGRWRLAWPNDLGLDTALLGFGTLWFTVAILAAVAASLGIFRIAGPLLLFGLLAVIAYAVVALVRRRTRWRGDGADLAALAIALLLALSSGALHHEYLQGQMDIGFYAADALVIADTGGRTLRGPDVDLIPGFHATGPDEARASIMFGYSAAAALFAVVGGLDALPWVNAPFLLIAALSLFLAGRELGARSGALFGLVLFAASFLTVWFGRWMMSENAALAAFWFSAWLGLRLARSWNPTAFVALLVALAFGALARAEGILVALWILLVLAVARRWTPARVLARARASLRGLDVRRSIVPVGGLVGAIALVAALVAQLPRAYLLSNLDAVQDLLKGRPASDATDVPTTGPHPNWGDYALRYEWDSLAEYHIPWLLLPIAVGLALRLLPPRRTALLATFALPYVLFLLMPPVTTFHPWFLRRLWIALIPLVFLLAGCALDFGRAAMRWPATYGRPPRPQPRTAAGAGALLLLLVLLVPALAITGPVLGQREADGAAALADRLDRDLPPAATLLVDADAVGYGALLRLEHGHRVLHWWREPVETFSRSLRAGEGPDPFLFLRFNTTLAVPVLQTDPDGARRTTDYPVEFTVPPRYNLREYLQRPPLEQGYAPLRTYLDEGVPPTDLFRGSVSLTLVEAVAPLVLLRNVGLEPGHWERVPEGLRARVPDAALTIDPSRFRAASANGTGLDLYVAYLDASSGDTALFAQRGGQRVPLDAALPGTGSGQLLLKPVPLPVPFDVTRVLFPQGFLLRGAIVDAHGFPVPDAT